MTDKIRITIDGIEYDPSRGYGGQLNSWERGLKVGDTRVIADELMYVSYIWKEKWCKAPRVSWCLYELKHHKNNGNEYIRKFYKKVVQVYD